MKVFNGILGVFSVFGALYCIFWPDEPFLNAGWIITLVLGLWGICSIATYIINKHNGLKQKKQLVGQGVFSLSFGIMALAISILSNFVPEIALIFLLAILILFTIFLFVFGFSKIIQASKKKKGRVMNLVLGIVCVLLGVASVINWFYAADMLSIKIGVLLGVFGCILIASIFQESESDELEEIV